MTNKLEFTDRLGWEKAIEHHAKRIRGLIGENPEVFGQKADGNEDAKQVAIYLKGVEEGRKHSELVLAQILKEKGLTQ